MARPHPPRRPVFVRLVPVLAFVALAVVGLLPIAAASAESPTRVADGLEDDGVFVGFGRSDIDEAALVAAVVDARRRGIELVVVAPADPQPTAKSFARRIQEQTEADVALIFPEEGQLEAYVNDELEQASARPRAIEAARGLDDPGAAVAAFTEQLLSVDSAERPAIVNQILRALLIFALLIGAVAVVEVIISRSGRPAQTA